MVIANLCYNVAKSYCVFQQLFIKVILKSSSLTRPSSCIFIYFERYKDEFYCLRVWKTDLLNHMTTKLILFKKVFHRWRMMFTLALHLIWWSTHTGTLKRHKGIALWSYLFDISIIIHSFYVNNILMSCEFFKISVNLIQYEKFKKSVLFLNIVVKDLILLLNTATRINNAYYSN